MDGTAAIKNNLEALKRILAGLVAMAGLAGLSSPLAGEDGSARRGEAEPLAEPGEGFGSRRTLPRHLRLAILRLLRPAESAARRLIIASALGLVVSLPQPRKRETKSTTVEPLLRRFGIAVVMSPADIAGAAVARRTASLRAARPRKPCLPLFDPPRRFSRLPKTRIVPAHAAPRILLPGLVQPYSLPPPPSPDDPVDAARLALRLAALAAALDDLPGQARRFARWKARRAASILPCEEVSSPALAFGKPKDWLRDGGGRAHTRKAPGRMKRISPLRPGRPPGGRLSRYDPAATIRRNIREVDAVLAHAHAVALHALEDPDTS